VLLVSGNQSVEVSAHKLNQKQWLAASNKQLKTAGIFSICSRDL